MRTKSNSATSITTKGIKRLRTPAQPYPQLKTMTGSKAMITSRSIMLAFALLRMWGEVSTVKFMLIFSFLPQGSFATTLALLM